jgi:NADPH:quinone reductase-like Zn-dependent oxidoreductase
MATMQAVMLTKKGGPDVLETVDLPLPEPGPGEVRVKERATGGFFQMEAKITSGQSSKIERQQDARENHHSR